MLNSLLVGSHKKPRTYGLWIDTQLHQQPFGKHAQVASHTYGDIPCPGGQRRKTKVSGRYDKVRVELQGTEFYLTLFSLPLSGLDLVLGVQGLEMLGSMVCNWKQLTMDFIWDLVYGPSQIVMAYQSSQLLDP